MLSFRLPDVSARWPAAATAALLWAAVAGSLLLWWLHMPRPVELPVTQTSLPQAAAAPQARAGVARALGNTNAVAAAPDVQKRFVLLGVVADQTGHGSALLAVDGQPGQVYVQGQAIDVGWTLQSAFADAVTLQGPSGIQKILLKN